MPDPKSGTRKLKSPAYLSSFGLGLAGVLAAWLLFLLPTPFFFQNPTDSGSAACTLTGNSLASLGASPLINVISLSPYSCFGDLPILIDVASVKRTFIIWLFLFGAQAGMAFAIGGPHLRSLFTSFIQQPRTTKILLVLSFLAIISVLVGPPIGFNLVFEASNIWYDPLVIGHAARFNIAYGVEALLLAPAMYGMYLIHVRTEALPRYNFPARITVQDLKNLHLDLATQLSALSTIIGAATIASSALTTFRNSLIQASIDYKAADSRLIPPESGILFGLGLTLMLASVYLPLYQKLNQVSRIVIEESCKLPNPDSNDWSTTYQRRQNLEAYLNVNLSPIENLRASIALLAPFVASLVGAILPIGK